MKLTTSTLLLAVGLSLYAAPIYAWTEDSARAWCDITGWYAAAVVDVRDSGTSKSSYKAESKLTSSMIHEENQEMVNHLNAMSIDDVYDHAELNGDEAHDRAVARCLKILNYQR